MGVLDTWDFYYMFFRLINPFIKNGPFLYPLKTSENLTVFWCFLGVEKGCIGKTWVNSAGFFLLNLADYGKTMNISCFCVPVVGLTLCKCMCVFYSKYARVKQSISEETSWCDI